MKIDGHEVTILDNYTATVGCAEVTRASAAALIVAMDSYTPPAPKFAVGDFVIYKQQYGKVIDLPPGWVEVSFRQGSSTSMRPNDLEKA